MRVRLDLNDSGFQDDLLGLPKPERHSAMETLAKLRRMTWGQVYQDHGLKWEKIANAEPPPGASAVYSLRITQSRRVHGVHRGIEHLLIGSNTEKIMLGATCPVLTVGAHVLTGFDTKLHVKEILLFSDFTAGSTSPAPYALMLGQNSACQWTYAS